MSISSATAPSTATAAPVGENGGLSAKTRPFRPNNATVVHYRTVVFGAVPGAPEAAREIFRGSGDSAAGLDIPRAEPRSIVAGGRHSEGVELAKFRKPRPWLSRLLNPDDEDGPMESTRLARKARTVFATWRWRGVVTCGSYGSGTGTDFSTSGNRTSGRVRGTLAVFEVRVVSLGAGIYFSNPGKSEGQVGKSTNLDVFAVCAGFFDPNLNLCSCVMVFSYNSRSSPPLFS